MYPSCQRTSRGQSPGPVGDSRPDQSGIESTTPEKHTLLLCTGRGLACTSRASAEILSLTLHRRRRREKITLYRRRRREKNVPCTLHRRRRREKMYLVPYIGAAGAKNFTLNRHHRRENVCTIGLCTLTLMYPRFLYPSFCVP